MKKLITDKWVVRKLTRTLLLLLLLSLLFKIYVANTEHYKEVASCLIVNSCCY